MSSSPASTTGQPWKLEPGDVVDGRYRILRKLGEGGFATVYEAQQTRIDTQVALKVLRVDHMASDKNFVQRFLDEAKATASIRHPNIVTVYDFGVLPNTGQPYIAMERLFGHDLKDELRNNGPLHPERALRLFKGALSALGEAHRMGIVHKDLKPANLFLAHPNTPKEAVIVMDFGIARVENNDRRTGTGNFLGTPQYYAPEYIRHQIAVPALDVYQMGLILVEMFTGRPVVDTNDPFQCLHDHCTGSLNVPIFLLESALGPMLRQALRLDYTERYPDCDAFLRALESVDPRALNFEISGAGHAVQVSEPGPHTGHGAAPSSNQVFHSGAGVSQQGALRVPASVSQSGAMMGGAPGYGPVTGHGAPMAGYGGGGHTGAGPMSAELSYGMQAPPAQAPAPKRSMVGLIAGGVAVVLLAGLGAAGAMYVMQKPPQQQVAIAQGAMSGSADKGDRADDSAKADAKAEADDSAKADAKAEVDDSAKADAKAKADAAPKDDEVAAKAAGSDAVDAAPAGPQPCAGAAPPPTGADTVSMVLESTPTGAAVVNSGALLGTTPCVWVLQRQSSPLQLSMRHPTTQASVPFTLNPAKDDRVTVDLDNPEPLQPVDQTGARKPPVGGNAGGGAKPWKKRGDGEGGGSGGSNTNIIGREH